MKILVTGAAGNGGHAGNFDSRDDHVMLSDSPSLDLATAFTSAVWIKPDDIGEGGVILESPACFAKKEATSANSGGKSYHCGFCRVPTGETATT